MTTSSATRQDTGPTIGEDFEVLLISDDLEPGYGVLCPALPGCFSQGDDWDDALAMAAEAIACHLAPPYTRPASPAGEQERLIEEFTTDGFQVEVATVRIVI